ncbi:hypothetical protein CR513_38057, partial [Mucuna pruriens]
NLDRETILNVDTSFIGDSNLASDHNVEKLFLREKQATHFEMKDLEKLKYLRLKLPISNKVSQYLKANITLIFSKRKRLVEKLIYLTYTTENVALVVNNGCYRSVAAVARDRTCVVSQFNVAAIATAIATERSDHYSRK